MTPNDSVLEYATKEHTPEFKRAVEQCKTARRKAHPNESETDVASYCFAAVTDAFKKAGKPIFLSEDSFTQILSGESDQILEEITLAKWNTAYINDLPDSAFAYIEPGGSKDESGKTVPRSKRHLPYKDKSGKIDVAHLRNALARLKQTHISAEAKRKALRKLLAAARKVGVKTSTELSALFSDEELLELLEFSSISTRTQPEISLDSEVTVEMSRSTSSWKSLGHALQITEELIRPGVYQGIDGKKCRWTDEVLSAHYESLLGTPAKMFHEKEAQFKPNLPVKMAGKIIGFITHVTSYAARIFYKALVFDKEAQDLIKSGKYRSSLEARVALSEPDESGIQDVKAWLGIGVAYTDTPAVKNKELESINPVALARNKKMPDKGTESTESTEGTQQETSPPTDSTLTLSAAELQNIIESAVGKATAELSSKVEELQGSLKELSDVRNEARLAEISRMEEDIKKHDPKFDPKTLYDPEKASLSEREEKLEIYIKGINKGIEILQAQKPKPTIQLAEDKILQEKDDICLELYGKPYEQMLAAPISASTEGGKA